MDSSELLELLGKLNRIEEENRFLVGENEKLKRQLEMLLNQNGRRL